MNKQENQDADKLSHKKNEVKERAYQALQMRISGMDYETIAQKLGFSGRSGAYTAIKRELDKAIKESTDELIALSVMEIDKVQKAMTEVMENGSVQAGRAVLDCIAHRAKMLGLNAPERSELKVEEVRLSFED